MGFWHQGALGDFVLFTPVIDAFYELFPEARFHLWTQPAHLDLLSGKPYQVTGHTIQEPLWLALFTDQAWEKAPIPSALAECRFFFWVGQKSAHLAVERLQERLSGKVFWIQSFPQDGVPMPVTRFLFEQLKAFGFPVPEKRAQILGHSSMNSHVAAWVASKGLSWGRYGVVHMGSGGLRKVWPMPRWQSLFEATRGFFGRPVVMLRGPADEKAASFVEAFSKKWGWPVFLIQDLNTLMALLNGAAFFVGCDSGVSHVAAAMDVPSLVIFGPTDPAVWAPQGNHVRIYLDSWVPEEVLNVEKGICWKTDADLLRHLQDILAM